MVNQIMNNLQVFGVGAVCGVAGWYIGKLGLPVVWQIVKKIGYKTWEIVKSLASKVKFW